MAESPSTLRRYRDSPQTSGHPPSTLAGDSMGEPAEPTGPPSTTRAGSPPELPGETIARPAASLGPAPGKRIGPYLLLEELGRGGMGVVYRAHHPELQAFFAVKILPVSESTDWTERFRREARAAARLRHPGIVPVVNVGEDPESTWFAMELVDGIGLDRAIANPALAGWRPGPGGRGIETATAIRLTREIAEALHAAHESGIVHRDLKPANVLVTREGRPRVTDFGLARILETERAERLTRSGALMGTPAYMSPEQASGNAANAGPTSDVYQIGAILYELVCGRPPYSGGSVMEVLRLVQATDPPLPRLVHPATDPGAEAICLRAMARHPDDRYRSARELAEDCARWESGEPLATWTETGWTRLARRLRRQRAVVIGLVGLLAAVAISIAAAGGARTRAHGRMLRELEQAVSSVTRFEEEVARVHLPPDARRALAAQPLEVLEALRRTDPALGPAHSWCGRVKALLAQSPQELADAEADLDRGCRLSPDRAVTWYLRGRFRLERYLARRPLPNPLFSTHGLEFSPATAEPPGAAALREGALEDLIRAATAAGSDAGYGEEERRLGEAMTLLHRSGAANLQAALDTLGSAEGREASRLRGQALYLLRRFDAAVESLERCVRAGPRDALVRNTLGLSLAAAGLERWSRTGEDPRPWIRRAMAEFDATIQIDPASPLGYTHAALVILQQLDWESVRGEDPRDACRRAMELCTAGLRLDPRSPTLLNVRGIARLREADADAIDGKDPRAGFELARADFDAALDIHPDHLEPLYNRGSVRLSLAIVRASRGEDARADLEAAIADFDDALRRVPDRLTPLRNRGRALLARGEADASRGQNPTAWYERAQTDLEAAVQNAPKVMGVLYERGMVYLRRGEFAAATGQDPRSWFERALADFEEVAHREPDNLMVRHGRAGVLVRLAEADAGRGLDPRPYLGRALDDCNEVLERTPNDIPTLVNRSAVHVRLGAAEGARGADPRPSYERAIADAGAALRRSPDHLDALVNRASAARLLGEAQAARAADPRAAFETALADLDQAIRRNPTRAAWFRDRGQVRAAWAESREAAGHDPRPMIEEACVDFEQALQLEPNLVPCRLHRAALLIRLGRIEASRGGDPIPAFRRALTDADEELRRRPGNRHAHNARGVAWMSVGVRDAAEGRDPRPAFARAEADFKDAAANGYVQALLNLANLYRTQHRPAEAISAYEDAARDWPACADRARAEIRKILRDGSAPDLKTFAPEDRSWAADLAAAGGALAAGRYAEARSAYERALAAAEAILGDVPREARDARLESPSRRILLALSHYHLACILALASSGRDAPAAEPRIMPAAEAHALRSRAFDHLETAAGLGGPGRAVHAHEPDLQPLHGDARWTALLDRLR